MHIKICPVQCNMLNCLFLTRNTDDMFTDYIMFPTIYRDQNNLQFIRVVVGNRILLSFLIYMSKFAASCYGLVNTNQTQKETGHYLGNGFQWVFGAWGKI